MTTADDAKAKQEIDPRFPLDSLTIGACRHCRWWKSDPSTLPLGKCDLMGTDGNGQPTADATYIPAIAVGKGYGTSTPNRQDKALGILLTAPDFGCRGWDMSDIETPKDAP